MGDSGASPALLSTKSFLPSSPTPIQLSPDCLTTPMCNRRASPATSPTTSTRPCTLLARRLPQRAHCPLLLPGQVQVQLPPRVPNDHFFYKHFKHFHFQQTLSIPH